MLTRALVGPMSRLSTLETGITVTFTAGLHLLFPHHSFILRTGHGLPLSLVGFHLHVQPHKVVIGNRLGSETSFEPRHDFQQYGILTCVDSDEPGQSPFKLRNSK